MLGSSVGVALHGDCQSQFVTLTEFACANTGRPRGLARADSVDGQVFRAGELQYEPALSPLLVQDQLQRTCAKGRSWNVGTNSAQDMVDLMLPLHGLMAKRCFGSL